MNGISELCKHFKVNVTQYETRLTEVQKYGPSQGSTSIGSGGGSNDPPNACGRLEGVDASDMISNDLVKLSVSCLGRGDH